MKNQRADIQGLRALAVGLVVTFHLNPNWLPGGYIGVDVFFVISGFLITAHLLREVDRTGTVKLSEFWARRMRRLLPAALLVLATSVVAVLVFLPRSVLTQNLVEIALASAYVLNWNLAANSVDYFGAHNAESIAQHYWSLSVEEQFYIVWPLLIIVAVWGGAKAFKTQPRTAVMVALSLVFIASLAFSIIETSRSQPFAYFVTTTRAWEFAAGGLIGLLPILRLSPAIKNVASWVALGVVVACAFQFNAQTAFPGWIAILPVAAISFLLWVGDSDSEWSPQYLSRSGPVQLVGDTSYSIYLWHWPLIIVFIAVEGRAPGWKWMLILASATVLLAWLTKRYVEDPVRKAPGILRRCMPTYAFAAAGMVAILAMALVPVQAVRAQDAAYVQIVEAAVTDAEGCFGAYALLNDCNDPFAWTDTVNPQSASVDSYIAAGIRSCNLEPAGRDFLTDCVLSDPADATKNVALVGDSFANQLADPIAEAGGSLGWHTHLHSLSGCTGFGPDMETDPIVKRCYDWSETTWNTIVANPDIDTVIISVRTLDTTAAHATRARTVIDQLHAAGKQVIIVRNAPGLSTNGPQCVEAAGGDDACATAISTENDWLVPVAKDTGSGILDIRSFMCAGGACHAVIGGTIAYFDRWHLTTTFARTLAPWVAQELVALAP